MKVNKDGHSNSRFPPSPAEDNPDQLPGAVGDFVRSSLRDAAFLRRPVAIGLPAQPCVGGAPVWKLPANSNP